MKTARRRAREFAMQGIYEWQMNQLPALEIEKHLKENEFLKKADQTLFKALLYGVLEANAHIDEVLSPFFDRASDEVSPVERAILRLATFEILQHAETPYPVIINEAIELAKTFGSNDGHRFVNGVLDRLALEIRPEEVAQAKKRHTANTTGKTV